MQLKLPNKKVESFTKEEPTAQTGSTIKYGPYTDLAPFSVSPMRLHFENNAPFAVATSLVREVEISHWGNVYVEEAYVIEHIGAKTRVSNIMTQSQLYLMHGVVLPYLIFVRLVLEPSQSAQ